MKRLYVVKHPFRAIMIGNPDEPRIFQLNESVWWDEEEASDPVIFYADLVSFEADRSQFLKSIGPFAIRSVSASKLFT